MIYGDRLSTDVTVRKLQYRVDTVIRVSTQRRRHNFIVLPPYFYFYTCSCCSSPFPGKALALRTDSNDTSSTSRVGLVQNSIGMSETNGVRTQTHTKPRTKTDAHENRQNKEPAEHIKDMATKPNRTRYVDKRSEHFSRKQSSNHQDENQIQIGRNRTPRQHGHTPHHIIAPRYHR